jgi:hypothetical protein
MAFTLTFGERQKASPLAAGSTLKPVPAHGRPLSAATRAQLEPRFGHDFSQVKVHSDERAALSAAALQAQAYTVGSHIIFGAGRYQPHTSSGQRLIAHELAHVVQQQGSRGSSTAGNFAVDADAAHEAAADRAASDATHGGDIHGLLPVSAGTIQRTVEMRDVGSGERPASAAFRS